MGGGYGWGLTWGPWGRLGGGGRPRTLDTLTHWGGCCERASERGLSGLHRATVESPLAAAAAGSRRLSPAHSIDPLSLSLSHSCAAATPTPRRARPLRPHRHTRKRSIFYSSYTLGRIQQVEPVLLPLGRRPPTPTRPREQPVGRRRAPTDAKSPAAPPPPPLGRAAIILAWTS